MLIIYPLSPALSRRERGWNGANLQRRENVINLKVKHP